MSILRVSAEDYVTLDNMIIDLREIIRSGHFNKDLRDALCCLLLAMQGVEVVEPTWSPDGAA